MHKLIYTNSSMKGCMWIGVKTDAAKILEQKIIIFASSTLFEMQPWDDY